MTTNADPAIYPHPPDVLFDALFFATPETRFQVVWADRQLGAMTVLWKVDVTPRNICTIHLRRTASSQTAVLVQANVLSHGGGGMAERPAVNDLLGFIQEVASRTPAEELR